MVNFRGIKLNTNEFVYGNGIFTEDNKEYILDESGNYIRVKPDTWSIGYPVLQGTKLVYSGDIIRYTFTYKNDYYNRFYVVKTIGNVPYMEELYRDYNLDDDLHPIRGKFYVEKGSVKQITNMSTLKDIYSIVGNIWANKEFLE